MECVDIYGEHCEQVLTAVSRALRNGAKGLRFCGHFDVEWLDDSVGDVSQVRGIEIVSGMWEQGLREDDLKALLTDPVLRIEHFAAGDSGRCAEIKADRIGELIAEHKPALKSLSIRDYGDRLAGKVVDKLAELLRGVHHLSLDVTDHELATVLPHLANIESLDLSRNPELTSRGAQLIAEYPAAARAVNLFACPIQDEGFEALVDAGAFSGKTRLRLDSCGLTGKIVPLFKRLDLSRVEALYLSSNALGDEIASTLAAADMPALRELWLDGCSLSDTATVVLLTAPWFAQLTTFSCDDLGDQAIQEMVRSHASWNASQLSMYCGGTFSRQALISLGPVRGQFKYCDLTVNDDVALAWAAIKAETAHDAQQDYLLKGAKVGELRAEAKQLGVSSPAKLKKKQLIDSLFHAVRAAQPTDEDDTQGTADAEAQDAPVADTDATGLSKQQQAVLKKLEQHKRAKDLSPIALVDWVPSFVDLNELPRLELTTGKPLGQRARAGLLARLIKESAKKADPLLIETRTLLTESSLADFSRALWKAWDGNAKHRWAIYQMAAIGGDAVFDLACPGLDELASSNYRRAQWYLEALARHGGHSALSWIYYWDINARRDSLTEAAREHLQQAAKAAGKRLKTFVRTLDPFIADVAAERLLPRLDRTPLVIDYGPRQFEVLIDEDFNVVVREQGKAKIYKTLPKPRKDEDGGDSKELFKQLKKQVKDTVSPMTRRLENAMVAGRPWSAERFTALFVEHPVMRSFAARLVFRSGKDLFTVSEGQTVAIDWKPIELAQDVVIVHPLNMTEAERTAWAVFLSDSEIIQPFPQLNRRVFTAASDASVSGCGKTNRGTLLRRVRALDWRPWDLETGMSSESYRLFPTMGVRARIKHDTLYYISPAYEATDSATITDLSFTDWDNNALDLSDVPPVALSEARYEVQKLLD